MSTRDAASQVNTAPTAVPTKPPEETPVPFVVRIDKSTVSRYAEADYDDVRPVDEMVLGARARGMSRTIGKSHSDLVPNPTVAMFDIVFQGRTSTTTTSINEPGVVYGRTFTELSCTRRVIFDPKRGFIVEDGTKVEGTTKLVLDGFGSTRQFGRRLITRLTERQANKLFEPARRIADHDNKRDVRREFEAEVDRQLADANKELNLEQVVEQVFGKDSKLELFTKSSTDCIHIGVGPEGEKYAPMIELPERNANSPGVEIWVHSSILSEPVAAALKLVTPESKLTLVQQSKILGALSLVPSSMSATTNVALQDGWLILGLPDQPPPSTTAAIPTGTTARK